MISWGFPGGAVVENLPAKAGDTGSSPGLGRSHMPRSNWPRVFPHPDLSLRSRSVHLEGTHINLNERYGTSLAVQWLSICLPMQGTQVRSLVREDPTCHRATKPMHHNY
ncbi:hypothetical protein J1605_012866 [Eschrichtius robustus]|uniref:Uncharacterized protein n=1 Tax=Eschrichtius robustus TaxID=9764 RepID=A0AB34GJK5_ESCRO|nr:hypothetical protein J1605_012866 [Eschrichtius robustus]